MVALLLKSKSKRFSKIRRPRYGKKLIKTQELLNSFSFLIFLGLNKPVLLSSVTSDFLITRFYCLNTIPI